MKIIFVLSLKLLLRFIINGKTFPRHTKHMCIDVHVCMCVCMYVQDMCVHTCQCMHACACVYGVSSMIHIRGFLCTNSNGAVTERLYKSFPKCNSAIKHKVQTRVLLLLTPFYA